MNTTCTICYVTNIAYTQLEYVQQPFGDDEVKAFSMATNFSVVMFANNSLAVCGCLGDCSAFVIIQGATEEQQLYTQNWYKPSLVQLPSKKDE